jgi:hypothetical protein
MDWINIHRSTVQKVTTLAEPNDAWTWVRLQAHCHDQENGGRIAGAQKWSPRLWMINTLCTPEEVLRDCPLWKFDGDDLVVEFYPHEKEKEVIAKRKGNVKGARARWNKNKHSASQPHGQAHGRPSSQPHGQPYAEGNRKGIGIGKEEEEKGVGSSSSNEICIPSLNEIQAWALANSVDTSYAEAKWHEANEGHWWLQNGELIDWQSRWLRFWLQDRDGHQKNKKNAAAKTAAAEFRLPEDPPEWWSEDPERLNGQLFGMSQNPDRQKEFFRLRLILNFRRKHAL